jgi:tetratricopeptide (TPR) repeat protein
MNNSRERAIIKSQLKNNGWVLIFALLFQSFTGSGQVKIQEETMTIPTYKNGPPNPMPRFYEGHSHQGVQRRIYPYPFDDNQTTAKTDMDYPFIHVENEFIDLGIMPELGGRIYFAVDKTNEYDFFYRNGVIKPSLIGMTGNWISGSLAWGYPHHHGPNTVKPMDYTIEEHANGSRTVWISNTDRRHRLSVLVGYTVYPGSSIIEMTIHPLNKTPVSNSFLFWANPSVHCDSAYQVIFPPSVQYVTYHSKNDMTTWPIADSRFNRYDFTGMDISWWKNTHIPSSFFSWDPREDYFGGYDHHKQAGTVWVGNHHVCPGMKYWADGNNPTGVRINNGLTDHSGRYIELMAGFYTDNQPDYSWLQPYETKLGSMIWFPVRELEGLKFANRNGALNLEVSGNSSIKLRINTTSTQEGALVLLKTTRGEILLEKSVNISPADPFKVDLPLPPGLAEDDLDLSVKDARGNVLLSYRPAEHHPPDYPKPEPLKPFPAPEEMESVEELYLAGLRLNQFYNASVDPFPYYLEGLKRDPGNYRINTQLGILSLKDYNWEEAEMYLRTAVERITSNYTRPKDGEGLYYLGVALRELGKTEEAYDLFYQSAWTSEWHTPAYYQLAEIDCMRGDYMTALDHLNRSLTTNTDNPRAYNLKTVVLRKMNDLDEAKELALKTLRDYKIDHQALNELILISRQSGNNSQASGYLQELSEMMRDDVQSYLELATCYSNCGSYPEAADLLSRLESKGETFPMVYYYLGNYSAKLGENDRALAYYQKAGEMPSTYCFPFRAEEIDILEHAIEVNPSDALASYYLGNLLYEHQPEKAIAEWEKSAGIDGSFYIVHRNLGLAYRDIRKDYEKALASMDRAAACNSDDPRLLVEIDALYELARVPPQKKYEFLKARESTARKRSDALLRLATRSVEYGKYDEAIDILSSGTIRESEGAREMQAAYLNAFTIKGLESIERGRYDRARKEIETAQAYPAGLVDRGRRAQFHYLLGLICRKKGNHAEAETLFRKALEVEIDPEGRDSEYLYYQGLALKELGRLDESGKLFHDMLNNARTARDNTGLFTQFEGGQTDESRMARNHYLMGLAFEGLGEKTRAGDEFSETLKIDPGHVWSKVHLDSLQ